MRNAEFVPLVMELVRKTPGVTGVQTLAEAGLTRYPTGFVVHASSRESRWQALQQLADGEKHDAPAADIEGQPVTWEDAEIRSGDAWLAAVVGRAQLPVIARIVCWSQRPDASDEGMTVHFHNGARSFLRRI